MKNLGRRVTDKLPANSMGRWTMIRAERVVSTGADNHHALSGVITNFETCLQTSEVSHSTGEGQVSSVSPTSLALPKLI